MRIAAISGADETLPRERFERTAKVLDQIDLARAVVAPVRLPIGPAVSCGIDLGDVVAERRDHVGVETFRQRVELDGVGDGVEAGNRQRLRHDRRDPLQDGVAVLHLVGAVKIGDEEPRRVGIFRAGEKSEWVRARRAACHVRSILRAAAALAVSRALARTRAAVSRLVVRRRRTSSFSDMGESYHGKLGLSA